MSRIMFTESAWEDYLYWQIQDKKLLRKINALLKEIQRDPYQMKKACPAGGRCLFY